MSVSSPADKGIVLIFATTQNVGRTNHVRPWAVIGWNRPADVYRGCASPTIATVEIEETLPTS